MAQTAAAISTEGWLAAFGEMPGLHRLVAPWGGGEPADASMRPGSRSLHLLADPADWSPARTEGRDCQVIFDGVLTNR
ncbi:MAG: hypothetical protein QOF51_130, partial [Chloroflexota bacterium]|nr:hypothetical protein [Chloroflexota bacterium]